MKKQLIVILAMNEALALDIIGPCDVFSTANHMQGSLKDADKAKYRIIIASPTRALDVTTNSGLVIRCEMSIFDITEKIDTLIIGGYSPLQGWSRYRELIQWLREKKNSLRRICSVCVGAFVLAESDLLSGKKVTTHWEFCRELTKSYPQIEVEPEAIYIKDGNIYSSAGASAGIDLSLALVEEDCGREVSLKAAKMLVLYLKRPGNQSQFSGLLSQQQASKKSMQELQQWISLHLKQNLNVEVLSARIAMSPRNFARVFASEFGVTPAKFIEKLRLESAKRLLEETDLSLQKICDECGFGNTDTMRNIFMRHLKTTPFNYRHLFGETHI
jgi:transcriptional regulator GlxA family with amidase domain